MRHFCWKNTQNFAIFIIVFQKFTTILADVPATPAITHKPSFWTVFSLYHENPALDVEVPFVIFTTVHKFLGH